MLATLMSTGASSVVRYALLSISTNWPTYVSAGRLREVKTELYETMSDAPTKARLRTSMYVRAVLSA